MTALLASARLVARARWCWRWPRRSDVLIFDAESHQTLLEYVRSWNPEVLHVRNEQYNVPVLLSSLLGAFKSERKLDAYIDRFIERVRPRLIITYIDNSMSFLSLSARHPQITTISVQNGWRQYHDEIFETLDNMDSHRRGEYGADYMLSFGATIAGYLQKRLQGTALAVGSIRNNEVPTTPLARPGTIAFVSQWRRGGCRAGGVLHSHRRFFEEPDRLVLECLDDYASTNGKRLLVIPVSPAGSDLRPREEAYYRELLGREVEFLHPSGPAPSYHAVDAADVVVSVDSTLGYESVARGNKTALFSIRGSMLDAPDCTYGWPGDLQDEGPFWTNNPDPGAFVRVLDHLFCVDDVEWQRDLESTGFSSLIIHDPGNAVFKSIIEREAGPVPAPRQAEILAP